jgi:pSer/pThr/pTyr-binding forkhead associated (FHA) protein
MRITLTEELAGGSSTNEHSFEKETVLIGRDAFECDISFNKDQYPMVSRRHAELRRQNGNWYLADLNSSYGTYHNEERLTAPVPVQVGSSIRIGQSGPLLRVTWIESAASQQDIAVPQAATAVLETPFTSAKPVVPQQAERAAAGFPQPAAHLVFVSESTRNPIELSNTGLWLGRDPSCLVIFADS